MDVDVYKKADRSITVCNEIRGWAIVDFKNNINSLKQKKSILDQSADIIPHPWEKIIYNYLQILNKSGSWNIKLNIIDTKYINLKVNMQPKVINK